jgi:hypothetical protein
MVAVENRRGMSVEEAEENGIRESSQRTDRETLL